MQVEKNDSKSLIMLIVSMTVFGTVGIFRRFIPLDSGALAAFRGFSGALFLVVFVKLRGGKIRHNISRKSLVWILCSGAIMGINWLLLFEAYNYTTVATATLCYYMEPTIVLLLSPLLFKEKLTLRKWICVVVSFVGMVLVSGVVEGGLPAFSDIKGILYGLGAACFYAGVVIINKKTPGIDQYEKTTLQLLAAAVTMIPYLLLKGGVSVSGMDGRAVIMLLIVGFIHTGVCYALYFGSMDGLKAQTIAITSYIDPVLALVLSAVVLHENLSQYGIIGAVMILISTFLM